MTGEYLGVTMWLISVKMRDQDTHTYQARIDRPVRREVNLSKKANTNRHLPQANQSQPNTLNTDAVKYHTDAKLVSLIIVPVRLIKITSKSPAHQGQHRLPIQQCLEESLPFLS